MIRCSFSYLRPWGTVPGLSIRANGSSLPLVLIKRIAHVRGGGELPSPSCLWHDTSPKGGGETWLSLRGRYVPVGRCPAADRGGSRDAGAARRLRGQAASLTGRSRGYRPCGRVRSKLQLQFTGRWFLFGYRPLRSRARSRLFEKRRPKNFYARFARPPARTCTGGSHRRGVQPPPSGATCPVRPRTINDLSYWPDTRPQSRCRYSPR